MSSERPNVAFYFDYISSNAYLAWLVLPKMATVHGYRVEPIPVLFAGFLEAYGQLGPAEVPSPPLPPPRPSCLAQPRSGKALAGYRFDFTRRRRCDSPFQNAKC